MRTRSRYLFLLTTAVLLLLILLSENLKQPKRSMATAFNRIIPKMKFEKISDHNSEKLHADRPMATALKKSRPKTRSEKISDNSSVVYASSNSESCEDKSPDCAFYNNHLKLCNDKEATRKMGCYKTCNLCGGSESVSENTGPVPVLIISYMRSGSTFTAGVIASYPSSYYLFEPIKISVQKIERNASIQLINGTTISTTGNGAFMVAEFLRGLFTCKFDGFDKEALIKLIGTQTTTPFKICLGKGKSNKNETVLQTCLKVLQKKCESSQIRVIKTIRVRMRTTVDILLKSVPGLKVINLFRDQRPRLLSAQKTPQMLAHTLERTARIECADAADDIAIQKVLKKQYPGQVETLLYERLAENPIGLAKHIFNFLGLPLTKESTLRIKDMTSSSKETRCAFCTEKGDSAKTAHAWRTEKTQNFQKIKMIEKECKNVQNILGYLPLKNIEQLRNTSISLRIDTPFTADVL
ncbi:carbohydrate sulfotransferase 4-like [Pecten maximus]|uniref:carbohydrate sulfotransferase 4-like n=1 Tax=Pecten maximus TaxID=6579 RepID=UPI0014590B2D|nr:carbohydrate sulfotransferase 4-like [Pecten maximus]